MALRAVVIGFVALAASACSSSSGGRTEPAGTPDAGAGDLVGPSGGKVTADGVELVVPAGALSKDVVITIEPTTSAPSPLDARVVGATYLLGPEGLTFGKPVTLTLPFDPTRVPAGTSSSAIEILTAPRGSRSYAPLPTTAVDGTHVRAEVSHFSYFVPAIPGADAGVQDGGSSSLAQPDGATRTDAGNSNCQYTKGAFASTSPDGPSGYDVDVSCGGHASALNCNCASVATARCSCTRDGVSTSGELNGPSCEAANAMQAATLFEEVCGRSTTGAVSDGGKDASRSGSLDASAPPADAATDAHANPYGEQELFYPNDLNAFAISGNEVYWVNGSTSPMVFYQAGLDGSNETIVDTVDGIVSADSSVVVDASNVYWTTNTSAGFVKRRSLSGGAISTLATGDSSPGSLVVDRSNAYFIDGGYIKSVPLGGGTVTTLAFSSGHPSRLAVNSSHLYWTENIGNSVMSIALTSGSTPATFAANQEAAQAIAANDSNVYWTTLGSGSGTDAGVQRAPVAGGTPVSVGPGDWPYALVIDDQRVYWANGGNGNYTGQILSAPLTGGAVTTLASKVLYPQTIEVAGGYVYFIDPVDLARVPAR